LPQTQHTKTQNTYSVFFTVLRNYMLTTKRLLYLFIFLSILPISSISKAAPAIQQVEGAYIENGTISIEGTQFGTDGPNVLIYDNFEGGIAGDEVDLAATIGNWDNYGTNHPIYDSFANSGKTSMRVYDSIEAKTFTQVMKKFPTKVTEIFMSFQVAVPPNTLFPARYEDVAFGEFPNESVWKFTWLMNEVSHSPGSLPNDNDICIPTHISKGQMVLQGNILKNVNPYFEVYKKNNGDTWWAWGSFNRISTWLKADINNPPTSNGTMWVQGVSVNGQKITEQARPIFDGGAFPYKWGYIVVPGWMREQSRGDTRPVYDDFYIAIGENAAARIELGNQANYKDCTNLSILIPKSWENDLITATIHSGSLDLNSNNLYLFVINADGVPSKGYPLTRALISTINQPINSN